MDIVYLLKFKVQNLHTRHWSNDPISSIALIATLVLSPTGIYRCLLEVCPETAMQELADMVVMEYNRFVSSHGYNDLPHP